MSSISGILCGSRLKQRCEFFCFCVVGFIKPFKRLIIIDYILCEHSIVFVVHYNLGVTISADMKVSEQCGIAASKGNQILGLIRRNITYKGKKLIIPLYKAIVRPHSDYKHGDHIRRIIRLNAYKGMIPELRDLSYPKNVV